jgi:hypothetical protein
MISSRGLTVTRATKKMPRESAAKGALRLGDVSGF